MRNRFLAACAALATFVAATPASAAIFTVDNTQSTIQIKVFVSAVSSFFDSQGGPGVGETTTWSGTIDANASAGFITINSAVLDPDLNSGGPFQPAFGGAIPNAPNPGDNNDEVNADGTFSDPADDQVFSLGKDQYGWGLVAFGQTWLAGRNLKFDLTGSGTPNDATGDTVGAVITDGWYSLIAAPALGAAFGVYTEEAPLVGEGFTQTTQDFLFSTDGITDTITIPILAEFDVLGGAATLQFAGQIVATAPSSVVIPEPTSGLFLASLAAGVCGVVRRRRK